MSLTLVTPVKIASYGKTAKAEPNPVNQITPMLDA
jgi:hypothetical protein